MSAASEAWEMRDEPRAEYERVERTCPDCGKTRLLVKDSSRSFGDGVCHPCANHRRTGQARVDEWVVPFDPAPFYRWWLDRYTSEEIRELYAGLQGETTPTLQAMHDDGPAALTLAGSAAEPDRSNGT